MKVRDFLRKIQKDGWQLTRTAGSHRQFHHPTKPGTLTVAGQANEDVPKGTLHSMLKQAGLTEKE